MATVPAAADHVALRALIKYLSAVHDIPYKLICARTDFDESSVKNYANDKSSRSLRAGAMYAAFSRRCAELVLERRGLPLDPYVVQILLHLHGGDWLQSAGIRLPAVPGRQPVDGPLANWLSISSDETDEIETRYKGLWTVLRASSFPYPGDASIRPDPHEFSCSLLNLRPRAIGGGTLCDFRWYTLGRGRELDERRVFEGYVIPNVDRIEFLGRVTTRHKPISLMVWRFTSNTEIRDHAKIASGICLSLNTSGSPVAARLRASFVDGSDQLEGAEFEALKNSRLESIGVTPVDAIRTLVPAEQAAATIDYLTEYRPIVGFLPAHGNNHDE